MSLVDCLCEPIKVEQGSVKIYHVADEGLRIELNKTEPSRHLSIRMTLDEGWLVAHQLLKVLAALSYQQKSELVAMLQEQTRKLKRELQKNKSDVIDDKCDSDPKPEFENDNPCLTDYERNR